MFREMQGFTSGSDTPRNVNGITPRRLKLHAERLWRITLLVMTRVSLAAYAGSVA